MSVQTIEVKGEKAVLLSLDEYNSLVERAELADDIQDFDTAMKRIADGEETFPSDVIDRLIEGESKFRVFREYRGMNQGQLADAAGISASAMNQIEKNGTNSLKTVARIAEVLDLEIDDLI